jgi:hypothetical protein
MTNINNLRLSALMKIVNPLVFRQGCLKNKANSKPNKANWQPLASFHEPVFVAFGGSFSR